MSNELRVNETEGKTAQQSKMDDFVRPSDWPAETGPIDLSVQDFPHASANTGMSLVLTARSVRCLISIELLHFGWLSFDCGYTLEHCLLCGRMAVLCDLCCIVCVDITRSNIW